MRRLIAALILTALCGTFVPVLSAQAEDLKCARFEQNGEFISADNVQSQGEQCRANVCGTLITKRNAYYNDLKNYSVALDEPFEELFLRLKGSIENYQQELRAVCGTEAQPLPVCGDASVLGDDAAAIRGECDADVLKLVDIADTVLRELLLQLAGNQRTHAYARRLDALAQEFKKLNEILALVVTYIKKIQLSGLVGDAR